MMKFLLVWDITASHLPGELAAHAILPRETLNREKLNQVKPATGWAWPTIFIAAARGSRGCYLSPPSLLGAGAERVRGQIAQQFVPGVLFVLFHLGDHLTHLVQDRRSRIIVDVSLQELQHVQPVPGI